MGDSTYIHSAHNVSNLLYHIVTPTKYRRMALTREVEGCLREICEGIELRWDWVRFLEVGTDGDHVHYLVQSTPDHSPAEIVRLIKGMTAKRIFAEHPEVKRMLWGGEFLLRRVFRVHRRKVHKRGCNIGVCAKPREG